MSLVALICGACQRSFRTQKGLNSHVKSCAWVAQEKLNAYRELVDSRRAACSSSHAVPSGSAPGMHDIDKERDDSANPFFPYPGMADALNGVVFDYLYYFLIITIRPSDHAVVSAV